MTVASCSARAAPMARPICPAPPVMRAVRPFMLISSETFRMGQKCFSDKPVEGGVNVQCAFARHLHSTYFAVIKILLFHDIIWSRGVGHGGQIEHFWHILSAIGFSVDGL